MVTPGPSRMSSVPTVKGGPGVLRRWRQPMGWAAMFTSFSIHSVAMAVMVWLSIGGQGHEGTASDDSHEAEVTAPVMQLMPMPTPKPPTFHIQPKPVKALRTANLKTLLVKSSTAQIVLPEWQMPKSALLEAPPAPTRAVAKSTESTPRPETTAKAHSQQTTQRKTAGKGAGQGSGNAKIAANLPHLVSSNAPPYPYSARKANITGTATVRVSVSTNGRPLSCTIQKSTGNEALDTAALRSVKSWRFTPAATDGVEVLVKVNFKLA